MGLGHETSPETLATKANSIHKDVYGLVVNSADAFNQKKIEEISTSGTSEIQQKFDGFIDDEYSGKYDEMFQKKLSKTFKKRGVFRVGFKRSKCVPSVNI